MGKQRGTGYSGPDSTHPTGPQESDVSNEGGTAPGGTVAFEGAASQWSNSNAAARSNYPSGAPNIDPISAAKMQHYGLKDESPAEKGDVPINPGIMPGQFRTARDANYNAPDGETPTKYEPLGSHSGRVDAVANDGRTTDGTSFVSGRHRGDSPEVIKNPRGGYMP